MKIATDRSTGNGSPVKFYGQPQRIQPGRMVPNYIYRLLTQVKANLRDLVGQGVNIDVNLYKYPFGNNIMRINIILSDMPGGQIKLPLQEVQSEAGLRNKLFPKDTRIEIESRSFSRQNKTNRIVIGFNIILPAKNKLSKDNLKTVQLIMPPDSLLGHKEERGPSGPEEVVIIADDEGVEPSRFSSIEDASKFLRGKKG